MPELTKDRNIDSCPLKVDPRVLLKKQARGDFKGAYRYYKSKVVFPEIISAVCSRPCLGQTGNRRRTTLIANIEKACAGTPFYKRNREFILREDGKTVAVIGGGIGGITSAVFFKNRGYEVHLYEKTDRLGGSLNFAIANKVLQRELYDPVDLLGICVFYEQTIKDIELCGQYDAVCNTAVEEWMDMQIKNLFHGMGKNVEGKIAAAMKAGQQAVTYLNEKER